MAESTDEAGVEPPRIERWRIVAVLLLASLVPLGFLGGGAWLVFGRLFVEQALGHQRKVVLAHAEAIDRYLAGRLSALELLAHTGVFEGEVDDAAVGRSFAALDRGFPDSFVDLGVLDAGGSHLGYAGPHDLRARSYGEAEWFERVMDEGSHVSDVFLGSQGVQVGKRVPKRAHLLRADAREGGRE